MALTVTEELRLIVQAETAEAKKAIENVEEAVKNLKTSLDSNAGAQEKQAQAAKTSTDQAKQQKKATDENKKSQQDFTGILKSLTSKYLSVAAAIGLVTAATRQGIKDTIEEIEANARLQAMIDVTGKSRDISVRQISEIATQVERLTNIDDTQLKNAMAALLPLENIAVSQMERIVLSAANISKLMGTDITSAVRDLGRVLENPATEMESLKESGIFISTEIKNQVLDLIEQNKQYEAQILLLETIEGRVGGVAEKIAQTNPGKWTAFWNAFKESSQVGWKGVIGSLPDVSRLTALLQKDSDRTRRLLEFEDLAKFIAAGEFSDVKNWNLDEVLHSLEIINSNNYNKTENYKKFVSILQNILPIKAQEGMWEEQKTQAAKESLGKEKERATVLEEQAGLTASLSALYGQTDEGRKTALEADLKKLQEQQAADQLILDSYRHDPEADKEIVAEVKKRIDLYAAVIAAKQAELDGMQPTIDSDTQTYIEKLFDGGDARSFSMDIPVGFDFGRTELQTLEEQLSSVKTQITKMWSAGAEEGDTGEWKENLEILSGTYDEIAEKIEVIKHGESLRAEAEKLIASLMTDEERKAAELAAYQKTLDELEKQGLLTAQQRQELWDKAVGTAEKELTVAQAVNEEMAKMGESLKKQFFTADALGSTAAGAFESMGSAIASGGNALDGFGDSMGQFTQQVLSQISSSAIAAGLRIIAETGWAGVPVALGLFALGGITGMSAGLMGGGTGIDDSITQSMQDELEARQKLAETINSTIDTEYDLLRRQLDRNLIDVVTFREGAGNLQQQRNEADARTGLSSAAIAKVNALDAELSGMSGWDKFWSGRDEDITSEVSRINAMYAEIGTASLDRLREIMSELEKLGVKTGNVPAFASGGEFLTTGPQLIMVGDNPGGVEHVRIRPVSSQSPGMSSGATEPPNVIYIQGDVYGIDDLYGKLQIAGVKLKARGA
ncbi:phage tail length tape measure family protein [Parasphaerochaeta coccoides]|uniref:Bacteriophage tail tape measure N-terminal domain-containing protein n=1 Tax=Parasphaerochaeta coccoides (strain ATCC BAA-1237 / DSM 17374 / SPN1) TaxID=760011 RepID=F4GHD1_PARC1|nr:phage tail length tape measure family protein [Parasphaerochaeta coccoides]AEC02030.1 hypothetical protein Spico_0805 [Parasphaerochaeta coccoides DSM 17374]